VLQYLRKVRLRAGGLLINPGGTNLHDIKIRFSISKTLSSTANEATIEVWNLAAGTRNAMGKELEDVELEAGYLPPNGGGNVGTIFKGQIRDVEHRRDGADIITKLTCGDGDRALRKAVLGKSYPKGTPVEDVLEDLYKEFEKQGVDKGEWKFPEDMPEFKRPYAVCGTCKREADTLGRGKDFYWSIQNGTMEVIPGDGFIGNVVLLTAKSGLIDTPTITDNGVKVKALLNPEIRPNRRIRVESETLEMNGENGEYRVSECTFSGDNRDGDFTVSVTGEALSGGKVDEGIK
jgi:hypothetical protein